MRLLRRLRIWLQRDRFESELAEELAHHRELVEKEQVEAGLSPDEAKRAAARQFGNATTASESARSIWVWDSLDNILQDIRYAWRGLARNPSLVALACLSLALSTGFGTTLFSIVNAVILQPITASQPESLVRFWVGPSNRISWLNYKDICEDTPGVACAGYRMEEASWQEKDEPLRVQVQAVTANYFELLGVQAAQGRLFDARMLKESPDTVVVTHAFWQRRLEGDPAVIGRKIILSGNPYIITAVLPQGFRSLFGMGISPALYVPVGSALRPLSEDRSRTQYELLGRLQPGDENPVSFRSRIQARGQYLEQTYPATNREMSRDMAHEPVRPSDERTGRTKNDAGPADLRWHAADLHPAPRRGSLHERRRTLDCPRPLPAARDRDPPEPGLQPLETHPSPVRRKLPARATRRFRRRGAQRMARKSTGRHSAPLPRASGT
jgi:hypothetical protein